MRRSGWALGDLGRSAVLVGLMLAATTAQALPIDVQGFHPSPFMHDMVTVETGDTAGETPWAAGLYVNYQNDPLVLYREVADEKQALARIISHQVTANLLASYSPVEWFAIGIDVPVIAFQSGDGFSGSSPGVASIGDIRLYPRFRVLHTEVVSLALTATLSAPTGHLVDDYAGRSTFAFYPGVLLTARAGVFDLGFNLAATITAADSVGDADVSHALAARLGLRFRAVEDLLDVMGEIGASMQLADPFASINESPAEALGALRFHVGGGVDLTVGGGAGITGGAGAPDARVFAGLLVTSPPEPEPVPVVEEGPKDTDGDGLLDPDDQCPWDPEDKDGFQDTDGCPDPDNDGDRILDPWVELAGELAKYEAIGRGADQCPDVPEDWDGFEDEDGCPDPDNDKDGFCDPWVAAQGLLAQMAAICKGIDQCPDDPETFNGLADEDGCPDERVRLEKDRIVILEVVHFYFNEARIKEESYPLLEDVTNVLREHPEVLLVRVEGHTDERGSKSHNLKLSKARAKAVRDHMVARGVDGSRLTSEGFGATRPIIRKAQSEEQHQQNRRVEFVILARAQ